MNNFLIIKFFCLFSFLFTISNSFGQTKTDSLGTKPKVEVKKVVKQTHSPTKATLFSAVIPGSGQLYNRKYWKVPVIYALAGGLGYLAFTNYLQYDKYRKVIIERTSLEAGEPFTDPYAETYSTDNLLTLQSGFRSNFEYASVGLFAVYVLQIVDATVDAHLFYFDVSDDLSLQISPSIQKYRQSYTTGINLTLNIKK